MIFEWTSLNNVTSDIVDKFDCGEETFNVFLKEQAKTWMSEGYAVTYVAVDKNELEAGNVQRIYGYAAVNSTGLLYKKGMPVEQVQRLLGHDQIDTTMVKQSNVKISHKRYIG